MNMKVKELSDGLILRGKANAGVSSIVVEVVETAPNKYYLITGSRPGVCWSFDDPNNFDCWDFEPVQGDTIGELINQIEGLLKFYRAEDGV